MGTIVVQMAEPQWTEEALHLACAMARNMHSDVILLKLIPVQHYSWLGTPLGDAPYSPDDSERAWEYKRIAEQYEADLAVEQMQYFSLAGALLDATQLLGAQGVFAYVPESPVALWRSFQIWDLRRQLGKLNCTLYTLDHPVQSVTPEAELRALKQQS